MWKFRIVFCDLACGNWRIYKGWQYSFLGVNSTLRDSIEIGSKNLIGAGAVVMQSTKDEAVWLPAKSVELNKEVRNWRYSEGDRMDDSYGINERWEGSDLNLEELTKIGFTVVENVFSPTEMDDLVAESEMLLQEQSTSEVIPDNESNMLRSPLIKSKTFRDIARKISRLDVITKGLGTDVVQLNYKMG